MNKIQLLDCTLRDGGRIIDCKFADDTIREISRKLNSAKLDIVEVGFLRNKREYKGNSTFFTAVEQIRPFIKGNDTCKYVAFVDYGMFDLDSVSVRTEEDINGIRFGFTKKNFMEERENIQFQIARLKEKGYEIYFQDVNTPGYSDGELLDLIEFANSVKPVSFGVVDTYGSMDTEELNRIFSIIHHNLNHEIAIDFHSHNNMQLSFALSQEMIRLCRDSSRNLIIDATLNGMGKCAGNLNTELIVSHMNRKLKCKYDMDLILDIIDEYLYDIKAENPWGYSVPSFMAGIYKAHPNNVIYLTEKFRLLTKDIEHIIAMIDEETRQTYDYDNIQRIYRDYTARALDDRENKSRLKEEIGGRPVLILVPGKTVLEYTDKIKELIEREHPFVITVNYDTKEFPCDYSFYGNARRYEKSISGQIASKRIISSNVTSAAPNDLVVNYYDLIESSGRYFDNTTIMLLNLLWKLDVATLFIAGFDGFTADGKNFIDKSFHQTRYKDDYERINQEMEKMIRNLSDRMEEKMKVEFLTPSIYKNIFMRG